MTAKQKLELTWIGKENRPRLEPRILLEDPSKSYHAQHRVTKNDIFDNQLIFGDNLLALKALEQEFTGKVKCIYIDPPFNTGSAFEHYDDGVEHSIWLGLMRDRLEILKKLLSEDGAIFVHIDYNEEAYLRVLMDEIFGRNNFRNTIIVSRVKKNVREKIKIKALNYAHDVILFYTKNEDTLILPPAIESSKNERWHSFEAAGFRNGMDYELFGFKPAEKNHWRWTKENSENAFENYKYWENNYSKTRTLTEYWEDTGSVLRFLRPNLNTGKPEYFIPASSHEILDTNWLDLQASSFRWNFPNGEKNEFLIQRILNMSTEPRDIVLDSFAGSGTTGAVAHKMGRRWIMIELGEHCHSHIIPRLKKVIDGEDLGGISVSQKIQKSKIELCDECLDSLCEECSSKYSNKNTKSQVLWKGGGGFRYYKVAPSLLQKDKWNNWIINKEYNAAMLAEAVCKLEGFTYSPSDSLYWMHGKSTETDFIYVTTQNLSRDQLSLLSDEVGSERTLLVMCSAFRAKAEDFPNLTIKKIPNSVLSKCEWAHDDYSLQVENLPSAPKPVKSQMDLFDGEDE